jgi:aryl-alcohol dehydrogenase-like predicted oxidoreductase
VYTVTVDVVDPAALSTERILLGTADLLDDALTPRLLDQFRSSGGRAVDLANVYADGESERGVGRWLAASGADVTLYVKGCHPPFCSPALVENEVDKARKALGVEVLDVFMLHRDDVSVPVGSFAEALLREVGRGSIGSFGVSNWTLERTEALIAALGSDGRHVSALSNHFSLAEMVTPTWPGCIAMDRDDLAALKALDVTAIAWASLAGGYFARRDSPSWTSKGNEQRRKRAELLAKERATTATAVALAYVIQQPVPVLAAVGTRSEAHLRELLGAARLDLSASELEWLEAART